MVTFLGTKRILVETEPGQEGGVKMVPMGLKGAVTCMQIIFIWLMLMERAFISRNRQVQSLYINSTHILAKSFPSKLSAVLVPKSNHVVGAGYLSQDRSARILVKVTITIPIPHP